ncbi:broad substrate specificity ATP-binding cassette transporter ABCG2-like [Gigantopelta aegis]|uniref:broad substrate specificity ATP-binding cassette transporter ABCG2-like n=1 Tax=Gigantopelta aegis TaxID=1735272 RepID=UPI001B88BC13|nr:broad substrate specificity ATP-binding cassette transporter ABCG2-like [Gigantopelta aegis]
MTDLLKGNGNMINDECTVMETSLLRTGEKTDVHLEMDSAQHCGNNVKTKDAAPNSDMVGSVLTVHGVSYEVDVRIRCCGRKTRKKILKDIHGILKPGMNAILGPTGGGKTSLLDILAGRKDPSGISGQVLIDGTLPPSNFKCMVGYVVQDDVIMGTLSVRENLHFSAALRLPENVSMKERITRVELVIQELSLTECADTRVGTDYSRGISGGERKRTNIGMELIISPPVLFLDEPTTGLDASTASSVMLLLKRLSVKGRTIVFSIHQPRFSIYRLFDNMILLSKGEVIYQGLPAEALDFFSSIGYKCEEHNNPPDFFLDVINEHSSTLTNTQGGVVTDSTQLQSSIVNSFRNSKWHEQCMSKVEPVYSQFLEEEKSGGVVRMARVAYATSFHRQLVIVGMRSLKNITRNPQAAISQITVMLLFAVVVGMIYYQLDNSLESGIQNRVGVFFFLIMNQVFGNLSAVELFIKERTIFMHENISGFYRVSAFFLSKIFCDVIPMRLLPTAALSTVAYWMIGLQPTASHFFIFLITLFHTTLAACSLAFAISASMRLRAVANLIISTIYSFMMLFSGLLINLDTMSDWLGWLRWLSILRYSMDALSINELHGLTFCSLENGTNVCTTGASYLDTQGIKYVTVWDLWKPVVALIIMTAILLTLTYVQLRRLKKWK